MIDYQKIKNQIIAESDVISNFGGVRMYKFLVNEILDGDVATADEFMLSKYGGYDRDELSQIKSEIKKKHNYRMKASIPMSAF